MACICAAVDGMCMRCSILLRATVATASDCHQIFLSLLNYAPLLLTLFLLHAQPPPVSPHSSGCLLLCDALQLCGCSWFGLDAIGEGQCSPFACNDMFLLASILRMEWMAPGEKAARKYVAGTCVHKKERTHTCTHMRTHRYIHTHAQPHVMHTL